MNDRETRRYDMLGRVGTFGTDNQANFDAAESDDSEGVVSPAEAAERNKDGWRMGEHAVGRIIKAGMKEVNYLDAIIHNKYSRQPEKLRAWQSASRIERAPQREKKPEPPARGTGSTPPAPKPPGA